MAPTWAGPGWLSELLEQLTKQRDKMALRDWKDSGGKTATSGTSALSTPQ